MKNLLRVELRKAFFSRTSLFCLCTAMLLIVAHLIVSVKAYYEYGIMAQIGWMNELGQSHEIAFDAHTLYNRWIGTNYATLGNTLFYYLLPLLTMMPCALSNFDELHSGYLKTVIPKCGRREYLASKLIATFLCGGTIIAVSMLSSVLLTAMFIPAIKPNVINMMYYNIYRGDMMSSLAYMHPLVYIFIYILIDFIFSGLFACMPFAVAFVSRSRFACIALPYIFILLCDKAKAFLYYLSDISISPFWLMRAIPPGFSNKSYMVIAWYGVFSALVLLPTIIRGRRWDIV